MSHKHSRLPIYIMLLIFFLGLALIYAFLVRGAPSSKTAATPLPASQTATFPPAAAQPEDTPTAADMPAAASTTTPGKPSKNQGAVFYVATTGSDTNDGSISKPWRTIANGIKALKPGDTLFLKSGTYVQGSSLKISASGDAVKGHITISTAPGEPALAVITGDTNGDGKAETPQEGKWEQLVYLRGSYLRFQNIEVSYSNGRGITSSGASNIIYGNQVHHIWNGGIYVNGPDNIVENNTVWRSGDSNYCDGITGRQCNGDWASGIGWGDPHGTTPPGSAPRIIVRGNRVFNSSGEGIICMHTDYGLIEENIVFDNWALNIDLDQCSYTTIQKNLAYYTGDTLWWKRENQPGAGILLSNEGIQDKAGKTYPIGHSRKVINNILVGNGINFNFWASEKHDASALNNDLIAGNTMVDAQGTAGRNLNIDNGPHRSTRFVNNIFLQSSGTIAVVETISGLTFESNLWSQPPPQGLSSPTDVTDDPRLIDSAHPRSPGAVLAEWYQIRGTSPCIGKGQDLPEIPSDYWDAQRDADPDIGANEYRP